MVGVARIVNDVKGAHIVYGDLRLDATVRNPINAHATLRVPVLRKTVYSGSKSERSLPS